MFLADAEEGELITLSGEVEMAERQAVDARGAFCPGPLMELIAALKLAMVSDEVEVLSSDKGSVNDTPAWVAKVGHQFVGSTELGGY